MGCAAVTTNPPLSASSPPAANHDKIEGDLLVGIAVSGGGSRAAIFTTAVLEQLWNRKPELMKEVDHISSVSGGSMASAYYVLHKPDGKPDGDFWSDMRDDLSKDFIWRGIGTILIPPVRWQVLFSGYTLTDLMAAKFSNNLYGDSTLGELEVRAHIDEKAAETGDLRDEERVFVPHLLINSTVYRCERSTNIDPAKDPEGFVRESLVWGRKFVFTDLPWQHFRESLKGSIEDGHENPDFRVWTPREIGSDVRDMRLDRAVMASAAFPVIFAPLHLKDHSADASEDDPFVELGDGGLYDNSGLETLVQLYSHILENPENENKHALIIVIDSSAPYRFSGGNVEEAGAAFAIMERRGQSLAKMVMKDGRNCGKT